MVGQVFANACPFPFSDTALHQNQLDDVKGSPGSSEEVPDGTLKVSPTYHSLFSEQPGSGWAQGDKGEQGLILAVKEASPEVGSRKKGFLCYHVTGCTL